MFRADYIYMIVTIALALVANVAQGRHASSRGVAGAGGDEQGKEFLRNLGGALNQAGGGPGLGGMGGMQPYKTPDRSKAIDEAVGSKVRDKFEQTMDKATQSFQASVEKANAAGQKLMDAAAKIPQDDSSAIQTTQTVLDKRLETFANSPKLGEATVAQSEKLLYDDAAVQAATVNVRLKSSRTVSSAVPALQDGLTVGEKMQVAYGGARVTASSPLGSSLPPRSTPSGSPTPPGYHLSPREPVGHAMAPFFKNH